MKERLHRILTGIEALLAERQAPISPAAVIAMLGLVRCAVGARGTGRPRHEASADARLEARRDAVRAAARRQYARRLAVARGEAPPPVLTGGRPRAEVSQDPQVERDRAANRRWRARVSARTKGGDAAAGDHVADAGKMVEAGQCARLPDPVADVQVVPERLADTSLIDCARQVAAAEPAPVPAPIVPAPNAMPRPVAQLQVPSPKPAPQTLDSLRDIAGDMVLALTDRDHADIDEMLAEGATGRAIAAELDLPLGLVANYVALRRSAAA